MFDLEKFNKENPILEVGEESTDPFVERVNSKELSETNGCWCCLKEFDATGKIISEADANGEDATSYSKLCPACKKLLGDTGYSFNLGGQYD